MKGDYLITLDFLKAHDACEDGQSEFERVFPDGGEYQVVLDRCAYENRMNFAQWLMNICGPSDDIRTFEDDIDEPDKNIAFAGTLYFKKGVNVKRILAGCDIEAGDGIVVGESIDAGYNIQAGRGIKAGYSIDAGWGIKAGECIKAKYIIKASKGIKAEHDIKAGCNIKANCDIEAGYDIVAGCDIEAGKGIKAGYNITAGSNIKAGRSINAGYNIKVGAEYGIFAGLNIKVSDWSKYAIVTAQNKPANLMTGFWKSK